MQASFITTFMRMGVPTVVVLPHDTGTKSSDDKFMCYLAVDSKEFGYFVMNSRLVG